MCAGGHAVVHVRAFAMIPGGLLATSIGNMELPPAMPAPQQACEQGGSHPDGAPGHGALHVGIVGNDPLVGLELFPADVALMVLAQQHGPVLPGDPYALQDALAPVLQPHARRGAPEV